MGFAASALMAEAMASKRFYGLALSGDGAFVMNPQILLDGVQHGASKVAWWYSTTVAWVRYPACSRLSSARDYATSDDVNVDYVAWARAIEGVEAFHGGYTVRELKAALDKARAHDGLSLIHVPVYFGDDELGGMGVFGRWNVGNWCDGVQAMRHDIGL